MWQTRKPRQITSLADTSLALEHTCNGLMELSESLLLSGQQYVLLGEFTTDYLEATFGELRQGSGGT